MENITPSEIERAAVAARLTMKQVFSRSGVAASTFYRAKKEQRQLRPLTTAKLMDAIEGGKDD